VATVNTAIRQFAISTSEWTPIVTPIDCSYFILIGNQDGSAMQRCSDPNDITTSYTMQAGGWYALNASGVGVTGWNGKPARFPAGATVTYIKALSGVGPVIVEFIL
jgi:hypothetical protein